MRHTVDARHILNDPVENSELMRRVFSMQENGISYGDVEPRYAGDPAENPLYEKKYGEFNAVAFGLAAAGLQSLNFVPSECPDFEIWRDNSPFAYIEVVSVIEREDARYDGLLRQINVALARRSRDDLAFANRINGVFCEIILPDPPRKSARDAMVSEIVELMATEDLSVEVVTLFEIDSRYEMLHAAHAQYIVTASSNESHVAFRQPAQTYSSQSVADLVLTSVRAKRLKAETYAASPLWLMAYCEVPGICSGLEYLMRATIEIEPFERVFIGGQRRVLELISVDVI